MNDDAESFSKSAFCLQGYEQFVGSKTNLRWENTRWSGFREDSTEALISWYSKRGI